VRQIPSLFIQALHELELTEIIVFPLAFAHIGRVFAGFAVQFVSWAGQQVWNLLQIIFEVVAPGVMPYLRRAAGAFRTIIHDPIGFIRNLVRAGIQGFHQFAAHFLTHLRASLIGWLTGTLAGANIYIPQGFTFIEIIKFVLSVLGLTWQNIRQKLVRRIGETAVRALEIGFDLVVTLVRDGPAAAWHKIQEHLSNLREMVMEQVMTFVRERIVQAAITRLVTSLNPAGAFIQAIIAIYDTIMFFVERLRQIAQVAAAFIDSISAIASGVITAAANRVEQTMAGLLTLVISFLARLVGLGRVSDVVVNTVNRIREPIDRALDRVVDWIVDAARRVGRFVIGTARSAAGAVAEWWRYRQTFTGTDRRPHTIAVDRRGTQAVIIVRSNEQTLEQIIANQAEPKKGQLQAKYSEINGLVGGSEPDPAQHEQRHRRVELVINQVADLLGNNSVRPTTVTYATTSGGRANRVIAAPLTSRAGNTVGSPVHGIQFRDLVSAIVEPRRQEEHQTNPGREVFSMFRSAHLLAEKIKGPAESWNLANAGTGINTRMRRPEDAAEDLTNRGAELRYVTTVRYHTEDSPQTDRVLLGSGTPAQKLRWLGSLVARTYHVNISVLTPPPDGLGGAQVGDFGPFDDGPDFLAGLQLRGGPAPKPLSELVLAKAIATAEVRPEGRRVRGSNFLAGELGKDNRLVLEALEELETRGVLYRGQGDRRYIRE
jgi:hypothetical protein